MFVWEKRSEYKTPTAWNSNGIPCRGQWFQTINVLFRASFALLQILLGGGEHEFDSVELVDFAGTGIVVDGYDVGGRICLPQSLDNALTYHVVRQAAEGLGTYDVRYAFLDQFHHLTGQEPSLTGLVADGYDRFRIGDDLVNAGRRIKMLTFFKSLHGRAAEDMFDGPDTQCRDLRSFFAGA